MITSKLFRTIKDVIKHLQGINSKDENKKIEGTSFGFLRMALLDYPVIYLEKIFVNFFLIFKKLENCSNQRQIQTRISNIF